VWWTVEWTLTGALIVGVAGALALWLGSVAAGGHLEWLPDALTRRMWLIPVGAGGLVLPNIVVAPTWRYRVHRWELSADVLYTRTGWFNREWRLVPVSRIQTVDTKQGWLERALGLATLRIDTASHAGSSRVDGLPTDVATELAADLARRAHELRDDAT
jgi:uncharacterized protein